MRFFQSLVACAAGLVALAAAQSSDLQFTSVPTNLQAGQAVTITYKSSNPGPVTILLRKGPSNNLNTISTITTSATGGTFSYTPDTSLPPGSDYAFQITQGGQTNYSGQISITGGNGSLSSASASVSASAASVSSVASALSSALSSLASNATATMTMSGMNSTMTTSVTGKSTGASATRTGPTPTSSSTGAPTSNAAAGSVQFQSPVALIFGAVMALAYLN